MRLTFERSKSESLHDISVTRIGDTFPMGFRRLHLGLLKLDWTLWIQGEGGGHRYQNDGKCHTTDQNGMKKSGFVTENANEKSKDLSCGAVNSVKKSQRLIPKLQFSRKFPKLDLKIYVYLKMTPKIWDLLQIRLQKPGFCLHFDPQVKVLLKYQPPSPPKKVVRPRYIVCWKLSEVLDTLFETSKLSR